MGHFKQHFHWINNTYCLEEWWKCVSHLMDEIETTVDKIRPIWDTFPCLSHYGLITGDCRVIYNSGSGALSVLFCLGSCLLKLQIVFLPPPFLLWRKSSRSLQISELFFFSGFSSPLLPNSRMCFFFFFCQCKTCKNTNTLLGKCLISKTWGYEVSGTWSSCFLISLIRRLGLHD